MTAIGYIVVAFFATDDPEAPEETVIPLRHMGRDVDAVALFDKLKQQIAASLGEITQKAAQDIAFQDNLDLRPLAGRRIQEGTALQLFHTRQIR